MRAWRRRFADGAFQAEAPWASSFDVLLAASETAWATELDRVLVETQEASRDDLAKFFTAVYRTFCSPTSIDEAGGLYMGFDLKVRPTPSFAPAMDGLAWCDVGAVYVCAACAAAAIAGWADACVYRSVDLGHCAHPGALVVGDPGAHALRT